MFIESQHGRTELIRAISAVPLHVLEFKRALERFGSAQEQARQKAERQHDNLVRGLSKVLEGGEWRVTLVVFVGGVCGSVEQKVKGQKENWIGYAGAGGRRTAAKS